MPLFPPFLLGSTIMGVGSAITNRILQHKYPTPLESAQLENIFATLALSRQRIEMEERRAQSEWKLRREMLLQQIEANIRLEEQKYELQRWPLQSTPRTLIRASELHGGQALNVIVKISHRWDTPPDLNGIRLQKLNAVTEGIVNLVPPTFGSSVLLYKERDPRNLMIGQHLISAVNSWLRTEPTALIEISFAETGAVRFSVCCWGWEGDEAPHEQPIFAYVDCAVDGEHDGKKIRAALMLLIAGISDRFRTVTHPDAPPSLHMFKVLNTVQSVDFRFGEENTTSITYSARDLLVEMHRTTLNLVAGHRPLVAAEAAARAALSASEGEAADEADRFLNLGLDFCRSALEMREISDDVLVAEIMRAGRTDPPILRQALERIRGLTLACTSEQFAPPHTTYGTPLNAQARRLWNDTDNGKFGDA